MGERKRGDFGYIGVTKYFGGYPGSLPSMIWLKFDDIKKMERTGSLSFG